MKNQLTVTLLALIAIFLPMRGTDISRPEGWATCSSVFSAGDYDLTGGGDGSLIVLRNDGTDMRQTILDAVVDHDVIVFDGVDGDFVLPSYITFQSLTDKTIIGVNGARLCTTFAVTQEIRDLLDELDVKSLSQHAEDNLGGTLSNGSYVAEQCELTVRQALIDFFGDQKETYRYSGVFDFVSCSNIIIRNLDFYGPGSIDVGGADLITLNGSDHVWVDHCRFTDGMDGNLDIVNNCDFVTISDTHFRYTSKSYIHPLSNLNSGTELTDGSPQKCNVSWMRCFWDEGCLGRMPYTVLGTHHLLNCYWDCSKGTCIDAHNLSKVLIENSYFSSKVGKAVAVRDDNVIYEWRGSIIQGKVALQGNGKVDVPYTYTAEDVLTVPVSIRETVGPILSQPYSKALSSSPASIDFGKIYVNNQVEGRFNISAFGGDIPSHIIMTAPDGILLSAAPEGEYSSTLRIEATDENLIQADVYVKAVFQHPGNVEVSIEASTPDRTLLIPVTAEAIALAGEPIAVALLWPLDRGASSDNDAVTALPDVFSRSTFSLGGKINIHSTHQVGGYSFTLFNPSDAIGKTADDECFIAFDVTTATGYTFVPGKLHMEAARIGTDMCSVDIECSRDSGESQKMLTGFQPARSSNSPAYSEIDLALSNAGVGESLQIKIYLYNMSANKQLALRNVRIDGEIYACDSAVELIPADEKASEYYDLMGRRVMHPQEGGLYIERKGTSAARVVIYR